MKNYIYSLVLVLLSTIVYGSPPTWTAPSIGQYQDRMSFVGFASINGNRLTNTNDIVAAFASNGECRGLGNVYYSTIAKNYYVQFTVFSNTTSSPETIHFKIYDSTNDAEYDVITTKTFIDRASYGDLFNPYSFSNIVLSTGVEITDITFSGIPKYNQSIGTNTITLFVDSNQPKNALPTNFTLSNGATIFKGTTQITAGSILDFTNPIIFTVRSQNQAYTKQWTVEVKNRSQNTGVEITDINFSGILSDKSFDTDKITLFVDENQARNALTTYFTLSTGATIFRGTTQITAGSILDFTNPIVFTVRSQDQVTTKQWTIEVRNRLNTGVEITDITFTGITIYQKTPNDSKITCFIAKNQAKNALPTNFTLSTGASIFQGTTPITTGSILDFTYPIVFTVRSANQATKQWTIEVKNLAQNAVFYKKDFVCSEGGSIKIIHPVENTQAVLKLNGSVKDSKNITNGELIFNNLDQGTYQVTIDGSVKEIIINLKQ